MSTKSVSIILANFNSWNLTQDCLKSIYELNYPWNKIEVIVVDNHSKDQDTANIKKMFPRVKILLQKSSLGFAKAVNLSAEKAKGEFLFITTGEVKFRKDLLNNMIK